MSTKVRLVVVIPVGPPSPNCVFEYVLDTIASVYHYTTPSKKVIIVDDSMHETGAALQAHFPDLIILKTEKNRGVQAGLYYTVSMGFLYAYRNYDFEVALRLDTDALVVGEKPEDDAIRFFRAHPGVGIIGLYDSFCDGQPRPFKGPRDILRYETRVKALLKAPWRWHRWRTLRQLLSQALTSGYLMGEHCLGGGCFLSPDCIRKLAEAGLLLRKELCSSALGEDHVWGLLLKSLGIGMADFASGTFPMGVKWQGLPFSPQQLLDKGKKVIHSTRFWKETEGEGDLNEEQIRKFFRDIRQQPRSSALGCLADNLDLQSGNGSTTAFAPVATAPGPQSGRDRPQPVSEGGP